MIGGMVWYGRLVGGQAVRVRLPDGLMRRSTGMKSGPERDAQW